MKLRSLFALSCCLALMGPAVAKAQDTFVFPSVSLGNVPIVSGDPLHTSNPAQSATVTIVSTPAPANAYQFQDASGFGAGNLVGTVLADVSGNLPTDSLTLTFAQPITTLMFDYAISDFALTGPPATDLLTVTPDVGLAQSKGGTYDAATGFFEGSFSLTPGSPFSSATFTFTGPAAGTSYALGNLVVSPTAVPEPGTVAFALALGLPAAWQMRRKLARK